MRLRTIAEFTVATMQRSHRWKPDSPDRPKVRETLKLFLLTEWQEHGAAIEAALCGELEHATKATVNEMQTLFPGELDVTPRAVAFAS